LKAPRTPATTYVADTLVDDDLEVDEAESEGPLALDVLGPGLALNVEDDVGSGVGEFESDEGGEIALGVGVRVVEGVEAGVRVQGDGAHGILVGLVLTLAGQPDPLGHDAAVGRGEFANLGLEVFGHVFVDVSLGFVHFRNPVDHLVELEQNAGLAGLEAPVVHLAGVRELDEGEVAHLVLLQFGRVVAVDVLDAFRLVAVGLHNLVEVVDPVLHGFVVLAVNPDEGGLNHGGEGAVAEGDVLEDASAVLPGGVGGQFVAEGVVEGGHDDREPRGQERVEDEVEAADLGP